MKFKFVLLFLIIAIISSTVLVNVRAFSKNDFVTMKENHNGLINFYTIYEICKPIEITPEKLDNFGFEFVKLQGDIKSWKIEVEKEEPYLETINHYKEVCNPVHIEYPNLSVYDDDGCESVFDYAEEVEKTKKVWKEINKQQIINTILNAPIGKCWNIKISAKRKPNPEGGFLGRFEVDNILSYAGFRYDEWILWISNYAYRKNITEEATSNLGFSINSTTGFCTYPVWTNPSQGDLYVYYNDCANFTVANQTDEVPYEIEGADISEDYLREGIWNDGAFIIYHGTNKSTNLTQAFDSSRNTYHGNLVGPGVSINKSGKFSKSFSFDGDNGLIYNTEAPTSNATSYTIMTWLKLENKPGTSAMIIMYNGGGFGLDYENAIGTGQVGDKQIGCYGHRGDLSPTYHAAVTTTSIEDDGSTWYHVTCVFDNTVPSIKIYLNGVNEANSTGGYRSGSNYWKMSWHTEGGAIKGVLDEIRMYNKTLTHTEIQELYNNSITGRNMNLGAEELRNQPPVVNLIAPENNLELPPDSIEFIYNVSDPDNDTVENCTLRIENSTGLFLENINKTIEQNVNQSFIESLGTGNYTWKVSCYDNMTNLGESTSYSLNITGINYPPTIDIPTILPYPAYTDDTLNCSTIAYDNNSNIMTINFTWHYGTYFETTLVYGVTNGSLVSDTLTPGVQAKGETWNCTVIAYDGINYSNYTSNTTTILNLPPEHSTPLLNASTVWNTTSDNLTCYNQSTLDKDNDEITNIYSWYLNDNPFAVLNLPFEINASDYSGSNNHGSIYGNPQSITGKYGNALQFNGIDDYIDITDSASLDITDAITVMAWVKVNAFSPNWARIVAKDDNGASAEYGFVVGDDNYIRASIRNESGVETKADTGALSTDTWYHLAFTYDIINGMTIYTDGIAGNIDTAKGAIRTSDENLRIGSYGPYLFFNGTIDEIRIYNRVLSSDEIKEHYLLNYNKIVSEETSINDVWKCKVTPNDGTIDGTTKESNPITIMPNVYDINFSITSGEDGSSLTGVMIACDNDWGIASTDVNPYGPVKFYESSYSCEFSDPYLRYFNKTKIFVADEDKQIDVVMSESGFLSFEEHTMLEWLYNCWKNGDCWNLLTEINETTTNIWDQFEPTDASVVLSEVTTSNILSNTSNISIDYSIRVPPKVGYSDGDYLPIRIAYWFLDESNESCQNQDKRTDSNIAEHPYCIPLIAETLGKINEITNFTVDLRPSLSAGTYNIVRDIEIDPNQIWIKYGQEIINDIVVLEDNENTLISLIKEIIPSQGSSSDGVGSGGGGGSGGKTKEIIRERIIEREIIKPSTEHQTRDATIDTPKTTIIHTNIAASIFMTLLTIVVILGVLWAVLRRHKHNFYY